MKVLKILTLATIVFIVVFSCKKETPRDFTTQPEVFKATPYKIDIPYKFPTILSIPADNPMTVEGVELGRYLFYDGRMRGTPDTLMSCGTCHLPEYGFENGKGYAYGVTNIRTPHVMLPLINMLWIPNTYLWNGKVKTVEDLVWMGLIAPHEMNTKDSNRVKATLQNISMYPPMFKKAFGTETITFKNISKAISQFIRTLISANSRYDQYLKGEVQLTSSELNGLNIFNTEKGDCFHCHGTILFTTNQFYNNAKDTVFTDTRDRYAVTLNKMDKGAYKPTTLRNIELTGPYMHDGRFKTLSDVIDFYCEGLKDSPYASSFMKNISKGGLQLSQQDRQDLIAFLKALTDQSFITNPKFRKPLELP